MKGNSVLITELVVEAAEAHFEALREFVRRDGVVTADAMELLRGCKELETLADVANLTAKVMRLGMHRDGINGERFQKMLAQLSADMERLDPQPDGPVAAKAA